MAKTLFHKPRCSSCEYYGVHNESVPKKVAGAFLRIGCRYCGAKGFYKSTEHKLISDVFGFLVQTNEVIEIDDGLRPYYFFVCEYGVEFLAYFDRDSARKNKLDRSGLEEPDTNYCS